MEQRIASRDNPAEMCIRDRHTLASQLADEYVAQNLPDASARFAYLIARLREGVARLLEFLQAEQRQSSFRPVAFEQTIGEGGEEPLRVVTPEGREVRVIGQIDRVDVMAVSYTHLRERGRAGCRKGREPQGGQGAARGLRSCET